MAQRRQTEPDERVIRCPSCGGTGDRAYFNMDTNGPDGCVRCGSTGRLIVPVYRERPALEGTDG